MRPKSLMLLALALGCGLIASIGISQLIDSDKGNVDYETSSIYVALHNINLNDPINGEMVSLQDWPKDKVPQGAITKLEDLEKRRARALIVEGEPILEAKLLAQGEVHDPIGSIPHGMRLKTIRVDAEKSAAGLLKPGDRVDIQLFVSRNPGAGFPVARTRVILQNIRVYATDQTVQRAAEEGDGNAIAKTVSLLLTPEQTNKVALAEKIGELNLIPRNPDDSDTVTAVEMDVETLFGDHGNKNTRELEQKPAPRTNNKKGGFLSGLMQSLKRNPTERPPFVMEVVEAEEVREVTFDPTTGRPVSDIAGKQNNTRSTLPALPASNSKPAGYDSSLEDDFPIDFMDE